MMERIHFGGQPVAGFGGRSVVGLGDASLPSGDAAIRLMKGESGALVSVGATTLVRGALVATGLAVAGFRGTNLLKGAIGATLAIETFVLAWAWKNRED